MNLKNEDPLMILTFFVSLTIVVLSLLGLINKPVIHYKLDTDLDYNDQLDFSQNNITITYEVINNGNSIGRGWLGFKFINFTLLNRDKVIDKERYDLYYIYYEVDPKQFKKHNLIFNIIPNSKSAIIVTTINKDLTNGIVRNFFNSYCVLVSERPNSIYFIQRSEQNYLRAEEDAVDMMVSYLSKKDTWK